MAEHNAHAEELRFFAEEMRAGAFREKKWSARGLFIAYDRIAEYGQSILRPTVLLLVTLAVSLGLYLLAIDLPENLSCMLAVECHIPILSPRLSAFVAFTFSQSLPFINVFRDGAEAVFKELFGGATVPWYVQVLAVLQGIISFTLFFLIALGLRNRLRLN
jgi:hypothetical protein